GRAGHDASRGLDLTRPRNELRSGFVARQARLDAPSRRASKRGLLLRARQVREAEPVVGHGEAPALDARAEPDLERGRAAVARPARLGPDDHRPAAHDLRAAQPAEHLEALVRLDELGIDARLLVHHDAAAGLHARHRAELAHHHVTDDHALLALGAVDRLGLATHVEAVPAVVALHDPLGGTALQPTASPVRSGGRWPGPGTPAWAAFGAGWPGRAAGPSLMASG